MNLQEFNEILDFAVAREQEAVKFYHDLQQESKFSEQRKMLAELESMEMGHILVIEKLRQTGVKPEDIQRTPNLKIAEYLTAEPETEELNYQNILIKAMKREESSFKLYSEMSVKFPDAEVSTLFRRLAADEAKHKLIFEKMYDDWLSKGN